MRNIELPKACERRILMMRSSTVRDKLNDADILTSGDALMCGLRWKFALKG